MIEIAKKIQLILIKIEDILTLFFILVHLVVVIQIS